MFILYQKITLMLTAAFYFVTVMSLDHFPRGDANPRLSLDVLYCLDLKPLILDCVHDVSVFLKNC